jgi:hypothetical protein
LAQIDGNGKVVKEERNLTGFRAIAVQNAINLTISQGSAEKVTVETDENLLPYLNTVVSGGELRISVKGNVNDAKVMNVYVTVKQLNELEVSSAAKVKSSGKIETGEMKIASSSGSAVTIELACSNLKINMSSGSAVVVSGSAQFISANGSSGSALVTSDMNAEKGELDASSGAAMVVKLTKEVKARASSGAGISVTGNPAIRDTDSSSGGGVSFK